MLTPEEEARKRMYERMEARLDMTPESFSIPADPDISGIGAGTGALFPDDGVRPTAGGRRMAAPPVEGMVPDSFVIPPAPDVSGIGVGVGSLFPDNGAKPSLRGKRPIAAASMDGGDAMRTPLRGALPPVQMPPQGGDGMANALKARKNTRFIANMGAAAEPLLAALAGRRPDTSFYGNLAEQADADVALARQGQADADLRRDKLLTAQRDEARQKTMDASQALRDRTYADAEGARQRKEDAAALLEDPSSPASKRRQGALKAVSPKIAAILGDDLPNYSSADIDRLISTGKLREKDPTGLSLEDRMTLQDDQQAFMTGENAKNRAARIKPVGDSQKKDAAKAFTNSMLLRKEYGALPPVKAYVDMVPSFQKMQNAVQNPTAAGDLALVFSFMKMLDPGSTVREGEFANASNAGGVDDKIVNAYNKARSGERLTQDQRASFLSQGRSYLKAHEDQAKKYQAQYRALAQKAGVDPDDVVPVEQGNQQPAPGLNLDAQVAAPTAQDSAAIQWAKANPNDPRAAAIFKANGVTQ